VKAEITIFPYGDFEGAPVLALDIGTTITPEELIKYVLGGMRTGIQGLWIRDAPWGDHNVDQALMYVMADPRWSTLPVLGVRKVAVEKWLTTEIGWIADCSDLMAAPISLTGIRESLLTMAYRPQIAEIVVRNPSRANVKPAVLDALYEDLAPAGRGWLYTTGDPIEVMPAILGAATPWCVRKV